MSSGLPDHADAPVCPRSSSGVHVVSARLSCPPESGLLEVFTVEFDTLFRAPAQRCGFSNVSVGLAAAAIRILPVASAWIKSSIGDEVTLLISQGPQLLEVLKKLTTQGFPSGMGLPDASIKHLA